ncbi:MutH/Sau3AI family endonuclease [Staphylococcus equorum]|uniref:MutH/Sau3AI family endonuclease n=1 Tax=Staphylococcus equorum TaxID=246432 RepID=UPI002DB9FD33|nr:MutH/Sau3AI family endonuclease [Staphylococcus equorum]MEB7722144.1 restriction endonuclease [Staphylococcus equorum]MEB7846701.1 restriction endonuclease [Staphylococcus equorum]
MEYKNNVFEKRALEKILDDVLEKKLGEVDVNNVFDKTLIHPKITGIAGDVIEQSVIGYEANSIQEPDLIVDDKSVELKTTGIRKSKKEGVNYEAKEPMTITAVSPEKIIFQNFEESSFWHKLKNILLVYYLYDSESTVKASEYSRFPIKGYQFHDFTNEEKEMLRNDWTIIKDFIHKLHVEHEIPEVEYSRISSELRSKLMLIDTSPKWPNRPRFRLKRATVSTIVQKHFGKKLEQLPKRYTSFFEIDNQLKEIANKYRGKSIEELISPQMFNIFVKLNKKDDVSKSVAEQIVTHMFGANAKKLGKIELFSKLGIIPKTITQTINGKRTEDMKFFSVNFDEWLLKNQVFEESTLYSDFSSNQFLFIIFEEPSANAKLLDNKFLGFKRFIFDEKFIEEDVKKCWEEVREKVFSDTLEERNEYKKNGELIINKKGTVSTSINFPKSKTHNVFLRGSGNDSRDKNLVLNDISMYRQNVWIKGSSIITMLKSVDYI